MRKSVMIGVGVTSAAAVLAAGLAACGTTRSPGPGSPSAIPSATTTAPATPTPTATAAVSRADAERLAVAAVPGGRVTETRLDTDNGRTVWNVHLSTPTGEVEVKVDAKTGAVHVDSQ